MNTSILMGNRSDDSFKHRKIHQLRKAKLHLSRHDENNYQDLNHHNHKNSKNFVQSLTEVAISFCRESSLHGMKYVVDDIQELSSNFSRKRRLRKLISLTIWASSCIMGAVFAIVLIRLVWERFQTTPTITTVETNNYPIWNVPFPGVTICNINKVYAPATKNITEKLMDKGIDKDKIVEFLENLAKLINPEYIDALYLKTYQILEEMGYTTDKLMKELMQPCGNMIKSCAWLGKIVPCDSLFRVAKSSEGFCCSFNYKALKDSLEIASKTDTVTDQLNNPIYRVSGAGENVGLNILVEVERESYVAYSKSFYGAKILIHDAEDFPQTSVTTTVAQPGYDLTIAVIPSVIVSEPGIRTLSQNQRNCLFDDEKILRATNKYSFQSCMTECTVNAILGKCDCLPFYYPELDMKAYSRKYRQCSLHDVKCLRDNRHIFSSLQPPPDVFNETNLGMDCSCLPSCSERVNGFFTSLHGDMELILTG